MSMSIDTHLQDFMKSEMVRYTGWTILKTYFEIKEIGKGKESTSADLNEVNFLRREKWI